MKDNREQFFAEDQDLSEKIDLVKSEIDQLNQLCLRASRTKIEQDETTRDEPHNSTRKNCWEFKQCGREAGGSRVEKLGVCPAAIHTESNDMNGGKNAGRDCWKVAGTMCDGKVQGTSADKMKDCENCDFYKTGHEQEAVAFVHEWD
jgi:hypothetical protein